MIAYDRWAQRWIDSWNAGNLNALTSLNLTDRNLTLDSYIMPPALENQAGLRGALLLAEQALIRV